MSVCLRVGGVSGVETAGPMKSNLTTLFRQHIPRLFASQESDAWRRGSIKEGEAWRVTRWLA